MERVYGKEDWEASGKNLHLDLSYPILYNPSRINKPAFLSLSINP